MWVISAWLGMLAAHAICTQTLAAHVENQIKEEQDQEINQLVDEIIQNYLEEVKQTLRPTTNRMKRTADFNIVHGAEVFDGFHELSVIPSNFPNDILLFTTSTPDNRTSWFAAALEADEEDPQLSLANYLVLYKFYDTAWIKINSVTVNGGVALASLDIEGHTYIVVAEHYAGSSGKLIEGSNVYMFNETNYSLQYVQLLNTKYASDVIMWKRSDMNEAFVAVTTSENGGTDEFRYSTQSIVYHWLGSHFDIVDYLPTNNPMSIVQFNIGIFMFLAVANFQDNYGNTNIDSEIFRYDLNLGKFVTYQKLRTNAAVDIKYFCFESARKTESFLIVANYFEKDDGKKTFETDSIIYKLSDEEYFIPFQAIKLFAVRKWIPIVQNTGETDAFLLLAVCEHGTVAFQYDGWRFVEAATQYTGSWFGPGISSVRVFLNGNQTVFTLANKNNPGYGPNIFYATFFHDERIDEFFEDVDTWCEQTLSDIQASGIEAMVDEADHAPKKDAQEIVLYSNLQFSDVILNSVKTDLWLNEEINVVDSMVKSLNRFNLELYKPLQDLDDLERIIESNFTSTNTIYETKYLDEATINCPRACNLSELNIGILNGENMDNFIQNVIFDKGIIVLNEAVEFEKLALLNPLTTNYVNGHSVEKLVDWSQENVLSNSLFVEGNVTLKSGLNVGGNVDGIAVNEKSVWVVHQGQSLPDVLKVHSAEVEALTTQGSLNGYNLGSIQELTYIQELNASKLILTDRLLNGKDFENLNLMALKLNAPEQIVTEMHVYERMEADNVWVSGAFVQDQLPAIRTEPSLVSDFNPDYLVGKSVPKGNKQPSSPNRDGKQIDSTEPVQIIENPLFEGDLKINGNVWIINSSVSSEDLISTNHYKSAKLILEKGLKLNETNIPVHLTFESPFKAHEEISVDTINNISIESLVPTTASGLVSVSGHKTFTDGLKLEGIYAVAGTVNKVNISQLLSDTLQTNGDQVIEGCLLIGNVHAHKITSNSVYLNSTKWANTTRKLQWDSVSVEGNVNVDTLTVRGTVSDIDIHAMLQDSMSVTDQRTTVSGFKNFTNIMSVNKLETSSIKGLDLDIVTRAHKRYNIWKESELHLTDAIRVEHLFYTGNLDGIDASEFGEWLQYEGDQDIFGHQTVRNIQAIGGISAKTINNVDVEKLLHHTRSIHLNETIDHVIFKKNVKSIHPVFVDGKVQGLDLSEETVLSESHKLQEVSAHKNFLSLLYVNGSLGFNSKVNAFNLNGFCTRMFDKNTKFTIKNGSAVFAVEPHVSQSVNGYSLNSVLNNAWFIDENVTIIHPLELANAQLYNSFLQNKINNITLEELADNYLSKTRNQAWNYNIHFSEGITVQKTLQAPCATVGNYVSGIDIDKFKDKILLDGEDQVISGTLEFSNIQVNGPFRTTGTMNGLDLLQDVMRSDVPINFVKGSKLISKVYAFEMDMPPGKKLQNVDISEWNKLAVKTSGDFVIEEEKNFNGPFHSASNIRVKDMVNGVPFDGTHIMHTSSQQTVTGTKIFDSTSKVHVKDLELSGLLNSVNMTEFFLKQMYSDGNTTISARKTFSKSLEANKVYFAETEKQNLTRIEQQLTTQIPYSQVRYNQQVAEMHSLASALNKSLQESNMFVLKYSRHLDLNGTYLQTMPVINSQGKMLLVVIEPNNVTKATFSLMQWNASRNIFNTYENERLYLLAAPISLQPIILQNGQRGFVIESEVGTDQDKGIAESFIYQQNFTMRRLHRFYVVPKSLILHFEGRQMKCYINAHVKRDHCQIYCYTLNKLLHKRPQFECHNITQAAVLTTQENIYMVSIHVHKVVRLNVWNHEQKQFKHLTSLSTLNPVGVDAISYKGRQYIAIANQHLVGNTTAESVDIFRLDEKSEQLILWQKLLCIAPNSVKFAILPSTELVLYVLSANRATPFSVYAYRGIAGFQHLYTDATLPLVSKIESVTDEEKRHFVILSDKVKTMVLQANFSQ